MLPTCKWWAEVRKMKCLNFWRSLHIWFNWTTLSPPMSCTRGYLQMSPPLTKGFLIIVWILVCKVEKWTNFISFLFICISFKLRSKPLFKFSLPHPPAIQFGIPSHQIGKGIFWEMCVFPRVCTTSLTHPHTKEKIKLSFHEKTESLT